MQCALGMFRKALLLTVFILFVINPSESFAKKIVYIPIDDRPVCLKYTVDAVEASGYEVVTPPLEILASRGKDGDPEAIWKWLVENTKDAKAVVIASDSLIYGSLVQSRTHHLSEKTINQRINKLKELKKIAPRLKVYCFSSLLRTPMQSYGNVEPPYYEQYGAWFFRLGELQDKIEIFGDNYLDDTEIKNLKELIPEEYQKDWFERRKKNLNANIALSELARKKFFHYYAVGKDDHAPLSQTHIEARELSAKTTDIPSARMQIIPGIDQIGIIMLVRAITEDTWTPKYVATVYAEGRGPLTVPLYSDQPVGESINAQIMATGAIYTNDLDRADLVFVTNTPSDGINKESTHPENLPFSSPANRRLVSQIKELCLQKPVALADVAYANGADNGFMHELYKQKAIFPLTSYAAWNTADNSIGFALAFGLLAKNQTAENREKLLKIRLLDDWYYQSNVKFELTDYFEKNNYNIYYLNKQEDMATKLLDKKMHEFNLSHGSLIENKFTVTFPWNRLFEIEVDIK